MTVTVTNYMRKEAAHAKICLAMQRIERAQNELASACADLSAIRGGVPIWKACSSLTDRVKAYWYRVETFRRAGKFGLDDLHTETLRQSLERAAAARDLPARNELERDSGRRAGE